MKQTGQVTAVKSSINTTSSSKNSIIDSEISSLQSQINATKAELAEAEAHEDGVRAENRRKAEKAQRAQLKAQNESSGSCNIKDTVQNDFKASLKNPFKFTVQKLKEPLALSERIGNRLFGMNSLMDEKEQEKTVENSNDEMFKSVMNGL